MVDTATMAARRVRCDPLTELSVALHEIGNLWFLNALVYTTAATLFATWFLIHGGHDTYLVPGVRAGSEGYERFWGERVGDGRALVDPPITRAQLAAPGSTP